MPTELRAAMDKGELKKLLMKSKKEPVNCAVGMGDGKRIQPGLILLDRVKAPKAVLKDLEKQFPDVANTRFGTAIVDTDVDASLVLLQLNKPASGIAKRLVKSLKGTGFTKVRVILEDGSVAEHEQDHEQPAASTAQTAWQSPTAQPSPSQATAPTVAAAPVQPATTQSAPPNPTHAEGAGAAAEPATLTRTLTELVRHLTKAAPTVQTALKPLAVEAQRAIKSGDAARASKAIGHLREALHAAGTQATPSMPPVDPKRVVVCDKSRQAWIAARKKIDAEFEKLRSGVKGACQEHGVEAKLEQGFQKKVQPMLSKFDESLAHTLDAAAKANDGAEHDRLVADARGIIKRYQDYAAGNPVIARLDANPFVPVAIHKTVTTTLTALSSALG